MRKIDLGRRRLINSLYDTKLWLQSIWLFLFLNNISFVVSQSVTTSRVAFLLLLVRFLLLKGNKPLDMRFVSFAVFCLALSFFSALISASNGGDLTQFSRLFHFAFFSVLSVIFFIAIYDDEELFHKSIVIATIIQVVFVFITYTAPSINNLIFSIVFTSHDFLESLGRSPGLSSSGGATLSVIISLGSLSVLRLAYIKTEPWHLFVLLFILGTQVLVGRTGLLISLISLGIYFYRTGLNLKSLILCCVLVLIMFPYVNDILLSNEQFLNYTLKWASSSVTGQDDTFNALFSMGFKEMDTLSFFIGTGEVALDNGLNASGTDVGYLQTFFALGLMGVGFYILLLILFINIAIKLKKSLFLFSIVSLSFIIELKEPFIFKYAVVFYCLAVLLYMEKNLKLDGGS